MWPASNNYPVVSFGELHEKYDYVIIGGGTAGCVLANRLSASEGKTVLLIERGDVADNWASRVPLLSSDFSSDGSRSQKRVSEYQPELGRQLELVNGTGLGGSTRINQMLYARGSQAEYDLWAQKSCAGWAWKDVEPYFKKSERSLDGDEAFHGKKGEWVNRTGPLFFPSYKVVIDVCRRIGLPYVDDINSPKHPAVGCGLLHFTRDDNQHRHSAYHAFLPADLVRQRSNLHVLTNAVVEKLHITEGPTGPTAEGAQIVSRSGVHKKSVFSRNEIILCAGPFGSPHILMLSGIGPADHLKELGIQVHKNLPAVGENLQDHFGVSVAYRIPMSHSLVSMERRPWVFFIELFRWLMWGTGMLLAPVLQLAIFASTELLGSNGLPVQEKEIDPNTLSDIEIMPMTYNSDDRPFDKSRGVFSFLCVLLHPKSKGNLRLTSSSPSAPLKVDPRYLSNHADLVPLRSAVRLALRIGEQMRVAGYPIEDWSTEMPKGEDDASLDKFIRWRNRTTYHYSSTCRMGSREDVEDGGAVVDGQLKVFGINNLRIADSSVLPWVLGTHLQAPTVMVAERCADFILRSEEN